MDELIFASVGRHEDGRDGVRRLAERAGRPVEELIRRDADGRDRRAVRNGADDGAIRSARRQAGLRAHATTHRTAPLAAFCQPDGGT